MPDPGKLLKIVELCNVLSTSARNEGERNTFNELATKWREFAEERAARERPIPRIESDRLNGACVDTEDTPLEKRKPGDRSLR